VRSRSSLEPWWSRGHATAVEGPAGDWWMLYHGYERGFHTLGRQTLLEPVEWRGDGWLHALGGDLSQPMRKPADIAGAAHGFALSGPVSADRFGVQWCFHQPGPDEMARVVHQGDVLRLAAAGTSPADAAVLTCIVGDRAWQAEITLELDGDDAEGGLLLFYNPRAFVGLGFTTDTLKTWQYGEELEWARQPNTARHLRLRMGNDAHVASWEYSTDNGATWTRHGTRMEVSGLHHNTFGGFLSLRVALYAAGGGAVRLSNFVYRAIAETTGR
jgi:xylan 1,4-beta-xylosidase